MSSSLVLPGKLGCGKDLGWLRFVTELLKLYRGYCITNNDKFEASSATNAKRRFYQTGTERKMENVKL